MQFPSPLYVLAIVCGLLQAVGGANILAIFPFPGPSQYILVQPYLKALAARGHNLTVISAFPQKQPVHNFHDLPVLEVLRGYEDLISGFSVELGPWEQLNLIGDYYISITQRVLENAQVQQLLRSDSKFDLIIVEVLSQEALYAFAHHYKAPIIGVSSFGTDHNIDGLVGNTSPVSYIPMVISGLTDRMNFRQRLENLMKLSLERVHTWLVYLPHQVQIYRKYFPNPVVDLYELRKNFSLLLLNQHFSLSFPRPYVSNMIDVGGFHIQHKPAKLPADMEAFINGSTDGVIYFSLGSNIKSKNLPKEKLDILMRVFASLKQRIMWKFENAELSGKPDNVFISKWFPQSDILAHPKVKLFVTHGGLLSTIETICHGKPVVGMPVFYDQHLNVKRAKHAGFGLGVSFWDFTEDELQSAIQEVWNNPKFSQMAQAMSRRFHDQPMKPLDKAIYWTEYVLRHNGASHMRIAAQDLNFVQVHSLDTIAVLFGGLTLVLLLGIWAIFKLAKALIGNGANKTQKQKQN